MSSRGLLRRSGSVVRRPSRSWLADLAVAGGVGLFAVGDAVFSADWPAPTAWSAVVAAAASAFLLVRRVRPLVALTGALGVLAVSELALGHYQAWGAVLIALMATYGAAAYGRNVPFTVTVLVAFAAVMGLGEPAGRAAADLLWTLVALSLPLAVGLTVRRSRSREAHARRRSEEGEWDRALQVAAAVAGERRRIARELHDIISHALGVMVLQAGAADQALDREPVKARQAVRAIRATGLDAIGETGRLVGLLRDDDGAPAMAPQPTLADIDRLVAAACADGVDVQVRIAGEARPLGPAVELNAYRVVQEGLTNALKHAPHSTITITITYRADDLLVEVSNDGGATGPGPGSGFGLAGLRERVAIFGGRLEAGRRPAGGWTVSASFPASPPEPR
jgi:signal transduction histidine kinase